MARISGVLILKKNKQNSSDFSAGDDAENSSEKASENAFRNHSGAVRAVSGSETQDGRQEGAQPHRRQTGNEREYV